MKVLIPFAGMSQYDKKIDEKLRGSACGPTTAATILRHHEKKDWDVNDVYQALGTTRVGLFTWRLKRNFRKLADKRYKIEKAASLEEVKSELAAGRPLAVKFDRYFSFRWFSKPVFNYHWVPLVGFEEKPDDLILYVHDNGKRNRPSKLQAVSYGANKKFLTFVKIVPTQTD
ncbi:C39 family peptidase [Planococcus sp. FY231025]|uniref:C39 family peptidase n=1 Tax=Planococcus sp. FY231025 TaxID=3455699 RepID=UPI003F8ED5DD